MTTYQQASAVGSWYEGYSTSGGLEVNRMRIRVPEPRGYDRQCRMRISGYSNPARRMTVTWRDREMNRSNKRERDEQMVYPGKAQCANSSSLSRAGHVEGWETYCEEHSPNTLGMSPESGPTRRRRPSTKAATRLYTTRSIANEVRYRWRSEARRVERLEHSEMKSRETSWTSNVGSG